MPFPDLISMPFADRPVLLHSAWKRIERMKGEELRWKQFCVVDPAVRAERKQRGFPPIKLTEQDEEALMKLERPKKRRRRNAETEIDADEAEVEGDAEEESDDD